MKEEDNSNEKNLLRRHLLGAFIWVFAYLPYICIRATTNNEDARLIAFLIVVTIAFIDFKQLDGIALVAPVHLRAQLRHHWLIAMTAYAVVLVSAGVYYLVVSSKLTWISAAKLTGILFILVALTNFWAYMMYDDEKMFFTMREDGQRIIDD